MRRSVIWLITVMAMICVLALGPAYASGDQGSARDNAFARDRDFDCGGGFSPWGRVDNDWRCHHTHIYSQFMITPEMAWYWAFFKALGGQTYAGSVGWQRYVTFLEDRMDAFGLIDKYYIDIPYDHYIVDDWPDPRTHMAYFDGVLEKLVSDGTPVPVVASYGMTSGSTPSTGITAPMIYYDAANPPADTALKGKIVVFQTAPYTAAVPGSNAPYDYTNSFMDSYTLTDYEYRTPGDWYPLFTPPPASVTSSYHSRWVWNQVGGFARIGIRAQAAGMVIVYDLSPGAAFGLIQRSVYTASGSAGLGATYINCPTLALDRVNGAKVLVDAKAGKTATLTLTARFQRDTGRAIIGYLPGKNYGTPQDQQVVIASHTDAMSLVEEDGALGLLGILYYFNHIPQWARERTLVFYFDCRHFMPGGEGSWPQYDYYFSGTPPIFSDQQPGYAQLSKIVATVGLEHMGARQTIETGFDGNVYQFSLQGPNSGGLISSFIDINNNNLWLIEKIKQAAEENNWPRVDAKAGYVEPGVNGGYQGQPKSPMNKGRSLGIPGIGLAGDWPGCCTQSYAQLDTEAGYPGFDTRYFLKQVAGMSQMVGELMLVKPIVIDLRWGQLKSGLVCTTASICQTAPPSGRLPDSAFKTPANAATQRQALIDQYGAAFADVEGGAYSNAITKLQTLKTNITAWISSPTALNSQIDALIAALSAL